MSIICSLAASTIMRVTYGIEIKETNDIYIDAAERAMNTMIECAVPGAFLVDSLPIRMDYFPFFPRAALDDFFEKSNISRSGSLAHRSRGLERGTDST